MANKVVICGVNTSQLPRYKDHEMVEMMKLIKEGDKEVRDEFIRGNNINKNKLEEFFKKVKEMKDIAIETTPTEEYQNYAVSGAYLTNMQFSNMIREAEKYLGYPYVWGGSSPSTSFDCSGFVSYVINHCGNGWNYGRLTANGLKNATVRVAASDVKPGDLIFFKGTYNTSGASHVGIVVDPVNKIMIHCIIILFCIYNIGGIL